MAKKLAFYFERDQDVFTPLNEGTDSFSGKLELVESDTMNLLDPEQALAFLFEIDRAYCPEIEKINARCTLEGSRRSRLRKNEEGRLYAKLIED